MLVSAPHPSWAWPPSLPPVLSGIKSPSSEAQQCRDERSETGWNKRGVPEEKTPSRKGRAVGSLSVALLGATFVEHLLCASPQKAWGCHREGETGRRCPRGAEMLGRGSGLHAGSLLFTLPHTQLSSTPSLCQGQDRARAGEGPGRVNNRKQQGGALQGVSVATQPSIPSPAAGYPLSPPPQTQVRGDVFVHTGDDTSVCAKKPLPAFPCLCTR